MYLAVFALFWCGFLVFAAVMSFREGSTFFAVPPLVMLTFGVPFLLRFFRVGAVARRDHLVVRNLLRSYEIPRASIEGFRSGPMLGIGQVVSVVGSDSVTPIEVTYGVALLPRRRRRQEEQLQALTRWLGASSLDLEWID